MVQSSTVAGDFVEISVFSKAASIAKQHKKDSVPVKGKFCASKKPKQIVVCVVVL